MVIGGIGYCDVQNNFQFHRNVLEGLQIYNGSLLYGVFYPRSKDNEEDIDYIKYHFMLTPIPDKVWPRAARFKIRLSHEDLHNGDTRDGQTDGLQQITRFLADRGVAIIYSFSNRSGHRYSTWDIHVCFDKIFAQDMDYNELIIQYYEKIKNGENLFDSDKFGMNSPLKMLKNSDLEQSFDETRSYYREVFIMTKWISYLLERQFGQNQHEESLRLLFSDPKDIDLSTPVISRVNTSCHYFYFKSKNRQKNERNENKKKAYDVFTYRYKDGYFNPDKIGVINDLIKRLQPELEEFQLPSICFAEADSHYLNLRLIVIPSNEKHLFFKVSIFHERISDNYSQNKKNDSSDLGEIERNDTSRGLLNWVTCKFSQNHYEIWKSSILLFEDRNLENESYCNGKLSLFIKVKQQFNLENIGECEKMLNDKIKSLERIDDPKLKHIRLIGKCERVFPNLLQRYFHVGIKSSIVEEKKIQIKRSLTRDIFISYSSDDIELARKLQKILVAHGCSVFLADVETKSGLILANEIQDGMYSCREFCVLFTPASIESQWVTSEWGAAWALQLMPYTPILANGVKYEQIKNKFDGRIHERKCIVWSMTNDEEIARYAKQVYRNRFEALLNQDDYEYIRNRTYIEYS